MSQDNLFVFETERLRVRVATPADLDHYLALWGNPRVMVHVGFPRGLPVDRDELLEKLADQGSEVFNTRLVVENRETGAALGECKLAHPDDEGISEPDIKLLPPMRQTLFFSATMPDDIRELADSILNDPVTVQIGMIAPAKTVSHALYPVSQNLKKRLLLATLEQTATGRVLVFTRTKHRARNLARDLENHRYRAVALQGNMSQGKRQAVI